MQKNAVAFAVGIAAAAVMSVSAPNWLSPSGLLATLQWLLKRINTLMHTHTHTQTVGSQA